MNIDFHYGITYVLARLAGLNAEDSKIVAHSSQYVDDATTHGILHFSGGETAVVPVVWTATGLE